MRTDRTKPAVLVLRGGPDREREVSLLSGANVGAALREAGYDTAEADVSPGDTADLDAWAAANPGGVVFPALHGRWGEGGGAQALLEARGLRYVGCRPAAAALCFSKEATKATLRGAGVELAEGRLAPTDAPPPLNPPVVLKPNDEGSSIDLRICRDQAALDAAWAELRPRYRRLLVERYVAGKEVTVGVIDPADAGRPVALPPIWIRPATDFYDYEAKYTREDTVYDFDLAEPAETLARLAAATLCAFRTLGVRQLARADFIIDADHRPVLLEVNTMPGFTGHSLLPKAAARAGWSGPTLCAALIEGCVIDDG